MKQPKMWYNFTQPDFSSNWQVCPVARNVEHFQFTSTQVFEKQQNFKNDKQ